jgi:hypothetical protein
MEAIMTVQQSVNWLEVYHKLLVLEAQLQDLRVLVWGLKPKETQIECSHPVKMEGVWAGTEITEDDIAAAKRTMFSYEHEAFEA